MQRLLSYAAIIKEKVHNGSCQKSRETVSCTHQKMLKHMYKGVFAELST